VYNSYGRTDGLESGGLPRLGYHRGSIEIHMSVQKIIGREGRLVWDNFPVSLKYWMIEWNKPDGGIESWHGKTIVSETALRAMMEVQAKSRPIPITEPILAEFYKGKVIYSGRILISALPDPVDSNPVADFTGIGELKEEQH